MHVFKFCFTLVSGLSRTYFLHTKKSFFFHFLLIFYPCNHIVDLNTQVRLGYVPGQYQHSVRVCVPHDEAKLGLVSPEGANQT